MLIVTCAAIFLGIAAFYYLIKADALEQENLSLRAQLRRATPTLTVEYADFELDRDLGGGFTVREVLDTSAIENQPVAFALTEDGWQRAREIEAEQPKGWS